MADSKELLDMKRQVDSNAKMLTKIMGFMENLNQKDDEKVLLSLKQEVQDQRIIYLENGMKELQKRTASPTYLNMQQSSSDDAALPDFEWSTLTPLSSCSTKQTAYPELEKLQDVRLQQNLNGNFDDQTSTNHVQNSQLISKVDLLSEQMSLEKGGVETVITEENRNLDEKVIQLGTTLTEFEQRILRKLENLDSSMTSKMDELSSHVASVNSKLDTVSEQTNLFEATKSSIEEKVSQTKVIAAVSTMKLKQDLDLIKAQSEKEKVVIETNHRETTTALKTVLEFIKSPMKDVEAGGTDKKTVVDHRAKQDADAQPEQVSSITNEVKPNKNFVFFFKLKGLDKSKRTEDQCSDIWELGQHNLMCKVKFYSDLLEDMYIGLYSRRRPAEDQDAAVSSTKLSFQIKVLPQGRENKEEWALNKWKVVEINTKSRDWENTMTVKRTSRKVLRVGGLVIEGVVLLQLDFNLL